ncbi:alpha/beta hydrolase [bacterium]|nr:alpha/beta hydrolase [bacterium]
MSSRAESQSLEVKIGPEKLPGRLTIPDSAIGVVLFAHGSGSSRFSPRNQMVAQSLHVQGIATILLDLLSESESHDTRFVFDISLLAFRLRVAEKWATGHPLLTGLPIGFFGASTGAAAALVSAAADGTNVKAIVSRGGRPDLARPYLGKVKAPTLLIVGGNDGPVITINEDAYAELRCEKHLEIVPFATHLFTEPGALEQVANLASDWFCRYLPDIHE